MTFDHDIKANRPHHSGLPQEGHPVPRHHDAAADARAFRRAVDELVQPWAGSKIDKVAGIEARGFILGGAVAHQVSAASCRSARRASCRTPRCASPIRWNTASTKWKCMRRDPPGERVILVDDLIATGGTAEGAVKLLRQIGANVVAACFHHRPADLGGAAKLRCDGRAGAHADGVSRALSLANVVPASRDDGSHTASAPELRPPMQRALLQQRIADIGRRLLFQPFAFLERQASPGPCAGPGRLQACGRCGCPGAA
jgi:adenine phosphoribosyltransferase